MAVEKRPRLTDRKLLSLVQRVNERLSPDLLHPDHRQRCANRGPLAGHCYVACEALYHLGLRDAGYRPHFVYVQVPDGAGLLTSVTHWFLKNNIGEIVDPTAGQFTTAVPYHEGRACGFLTRHPSRRARVLIDRVRHSILRRAA